MTAQAIRLPANPHMSQLLKSLARQVRAETLTRFSKGRATMHLRRPLNSLTALKSAVREAAKSAHFRSQGKGLFPYKGEPKPKFYLMKSVPFRPRKHNEDEAGEYLVGIEVTGTASNPKLQITWD